MKVIIEYDEILKEYIVFEYVSRTFYKMICSFKSKRKVQDFCKKCNYDIITLERKV